MIEMQIVFSPQKLTELLSSSLRLSLPIKIGKLKPAFINFIIVLQLVLLSWRKKNTLICFSQSNPARQSLIQQQQQF